MLNFYLRFISLKGSDRYSAPAGRCNPEKATAENARVVAASMPNLQGLDPDWRNYRVSVQDVEDLTGLTSFAALPADVAKELTGAGLALFGLYVLSQAVPITLEQWPRRVVEAVGLA